MSDNIQNTEENKDKVAKSGKKKFRILPKNKWYAVLIIVMLLVSVSFLAMMALVNAFPAGMTTGILAVLFIMLIIAWVLVSNKRRVVRIIGLVVAILFLAAYGLGTYYLGTTYALFARISTSDSTTDDNGIDVTEDSFNVYITGIDQWNSEEGLDLERSDVNMIVTVCPKTHKILLTSIPRDSYVPLHRNGAMDKLTHTGIYGVDETLNTVEDWLGIELDYYVKLNFSSARDIINAIGGIDVYSPVAFSSSISDYSYVEGWNHLDGKAALYFARERKSFEGQDSVRVENQQRVVQACIEKVTSSTTLLTSYSDIVSAAGKSFETSLSSDDMQALVKMQLADLGGWEITTQKIEGEYDQDYVASLTQSSKFDVYKTTAESEQSCVDAIEEIMNPTEEELAAIEEAKKEQSITSFLNRIFKRNSSDSTEE